MESVSIDVPHVSIQVLHTRLGFVEQLNYPSVSFKKPLEQWKMEEDDAPIFRYLYRHFSPRRHLEFGTWQGTGVLYCLEECNATVWTINLLDGEEHPDGNWAYPGRFSALTRLASWVKKRKLSFSEVVCQTDSLGFIGRYYLERKSGHRVCQIYSDSRQWDISNYPEGFFDTCLIDGGHEKDVVTSDTQKACQLVRSGGLVMWHDFCPHLDVQNSCSSTRGVATAIKANWDWLSEQMTDIFWINPSWILLGIKK